MFACPKALRGTLVLDFSRHIPGPYCTRILADMGAKVVKVEDSHHPDPITLFPPHGKDGRSTLDTYLNHGKRRVVLDFNAPKGRDSLKRLVKSADVLVESFRPGIMRRLGLDYPRVRRLNSSLIYMSLTGYGQKGKMAGRAGHDLNFMATAGWLPLLGNAVPQYQFADFIGGGVFGAMAVIAALYERSRTRKGKHIDVAMAGNMASLIGHLDGGKKTAWDGITGALARYQIYRTLDGKTVALGCLEDKFWHRLCDALGLAHLQDIGFDPADNRMAITELELVFARQPASYWRRFATREDVCMTVSNCSARLADCT